MDKPIAGKIKYKIADGPVDGEPCYLSDIDGTALLGKIYGEANAKRICELWNSDISLRRLYQD